MSYAPYPAYKESGIPWLGDVPEGWEVKPLKRYLKIQNGRDYKHVEQKEGYPVLGSGGQFTYASKYLHDGEAVLLGRKGTINKPLYINGKFWTVDTMYYALPLKNVDAKFMYYCALGIPFALYSTDTALPSMTQTKLDNHVFAAPDYSEQSAVADFLDKKTAEIDGLIARQEELLRLLAEQRTALITHAVTKGLNPNAPMKPSGIDWLGDVPEGWKVKRVSYLTRFKGGSTPFKNNNDYWTSGDVPWVSPKDMKVKRIVDTKDHLTALGAAECASGILRPGHVLMVVRSGILRHSIPVAINEVPVTINQDMRAFLPTSELKPTYIYWLIEGLQKTLIDVWCKSGTTVESIETDFVTASKFPVPTIEEQNEISTFLDGETAKIDSANCKIQKLVAHLKEYRTALITNAVTGKIMVTE